MPDPSVPDPSGAITRAELDEAVALVLHRRPLTPYEALDAAVALARHVRAVHAEDDARAARLSAYAPLDLKDVLLLEPGDADPWLVVQIGSCNCSGGTAEVNGAHERHCGLEPLLTLAAALEAGERLAEAERRLAEQQRAELAFRGQVESALASVRATQANVRAEVDQAERYGTQILREATRLRLERDAVRVVLEELVHDEAPDGVALLDVAKAALARSEWHRERAHSCHVRHMAAEAERDVLRLERDRLTEQLDTALRFALAPVEGDAAEERLARFVEEVPDPAGTPATEADWQEEAERPACLHVQTDHPYRCALCNTPVEAAPAEPSL